MKIHKLFIVVLTIILTNYFAISQIDYSKLTGISKTKLDTIAAQNAFMIAKETNLVPEKEINPNEYLVGPGDVFDFSVFTTPPITFQIKVSPEGKLLIPTVGLIEVKGKLLQDVYDIANDKIKRVYKTSEIAFVLSHVRQFKVIVSGSVVKPISVPSSPLDRVSEVIERAGGFKYDASLRNISLIRNNQVLQVDLLKFFLVGQKSANPFVEGGDQIIVPPSSEKQQVSIFGEVGYPGEFEFVQGDSLSTLIRFAQGFLASANLDSVEVDRFKGSTKVLERWFIDLTSWKNILNSREKLPNDFPLEIGDRVYVRILPNWNKEQYVVVKGEVLYPGKYAIIENKDKIYDIFKRCGGFTEDASIQDIEFIRQQEAEKRDYEMDRLYRTPSTEMSEFEQRYFQSRVREKRGAMTLDFVKLLNDPTSDQNITLFNKDSIIVPTKKNYINVQGRVNNPGYIVYKPGLTYLDYINQAGGFGYRADIKETFIAKSKGEIFLAKDMDYTIEPGDVILVPPEKEVSFSELFTNIISVVAQLTTIVGVVLTIVRLK
ncbi:MAG: SLBB domain-containing protein [Candidatus Kapaibacteriota bacterium]